MNIILSKNRKSLEKWGMHRTSTLIPGECQQAEHFSIFLKFLREKISKGLKFVKGQ